MPDWTFHKVTGSRQWMAVNRQSFWPLTRCYDALTTAWNVTTDRPAKSSEMILIVVEQPYLDRETVQKPWSEVPLPWQRLFSPHLTPENQ